MVGDQNFEDGTVHRNRADASLVVTEILPQTGHRTLPGLNHGAVVMAPKKSGGRPQVQGPCAAVAAVAGGG
ncbi:hypothetical protein B7C62_10520 [Kitasatospora albolonga]|uniref:Uncharacterized protein n=1 Tax=Kitasatospora albolonga TaxID=68173 RepID=A0ABC8BRV3_9ACTN|nr:hypothetical protein B7C62_10520 [Kitasatospora albolonga]